MLVRWSFGHIVICFATLLYHFTHIWTNLLTKCTQCQFLSADVFFAGAFTQYSEAQKNLEKYIKKSAKQKLRDHRRRARWGRGASQAACWRGQALGRARRSPGWAHLLRCPPLVIPKLLFRWFFYIFFCILSGFRKLGKSPCKKDISRQKLALGALG